MPFAEVENVRFFYEKKGTGPNVLLMLPGALGTTRLEFDRQFRGFDCEKLTLVSWDAPGFGQSRLSERDYENCYERDARILHTFMTENLGIRQFHLLGFSDGGRTAVKLAAEYPKNVLKLILVGTTTFNSPKELQVLDLCRDVETWNEDRRERFEADYTKEEIQKLWSEWIDANSKLADFLTEELGQIQAFTLLLWGEEDIIAPIQPHLYHIRSKLAKIRKHIFPNTSHYCHQEEWREFNRIVQNFILNSKF